jgi:MFS family permease
MIHALLPIYLVAVLGTSTLTVGFIEGVAEATASITKIFSGALSDWLGKRKVLAAIGYGLAAFTKPIFPLAWSVSWLVTARFIDRVAKKNPASIKRFAPSAADTARPRWP